MDQRTEQPAIAFPIVGVGASAGGLRPLERFFAAFEADADAAFVVLQHLSPDFHSHLPELLDKKTAMRVQAATPDELLEPGTIYVTPPGQEIEIHAGRIRLTPRDSELGLRMPIDRLFQSLADELGDLAVGVVLSGTGSDGTRGLSSIKEAGGLALVQSEETAQFDGMPRSARDSGSADLVSSPEDLAGRLASFLRGGDILQMPARAEAEDGDEGAASALPEELRPIVELVRQRFGNDFREMRPGLLQRRVQRRTALVGASGYDGYLRRLSSDSEELEALFHDLVAGVSRFFDGVESFAALKEPLVARLRELDPSADFRVWVPGCATGEEAYSLAILLEEIFTELDRPPRYKVFATDIDDRALEAAGRASFGPQIEEDISQERLLRFFLRLTNGYSIVRRIRERVIFARHDLAKDPPFTRMQLLSCRNVLGSFQDEPRRRILGQLQFSLIDNGLLFVGATEGVGRTEKVWRLVDGKHRIFERLPVEESDEIWRQYGFGGDPEQNIERRKQEALFRNSRREQHLINRICELMAGELGVTALAFDQSERLSHVFGPTDGVVRLPQGEIRTEGRTVLDGTVRVPINNALSRCADSHDGRVELLVSAHGGTGPRLLRAFRVGTKGASNTRFLVLIRDARARAAEVEGGSDGSPELDVVGTVDVDELLNERIRELEELLEESQEQLQDTVHELEATNEELQSTNEELIAANEELQSTNEELHSVNEELYTVNAEHRRKILDLTEVNRETQAIFQSSRVGTVLLDRELRVRRYSAAIQAVLPLVDHDIGRPVSDLAHFIEDFDLGGFARDLLENRTEVRQRVRNQDGLDFLLHGVDLGGGDLVEQTGGFSGLVLSFIDISELSKTENKLAESEAQHRLITEGISDVVFWVEEHELRTCSFVSPSYENIWGIPFKADDELGWINQQSIHEQDRDRVLGEFYRSARLGRYDCEYRIVRPDGEVRWIHDRAYRVEGDEGGRTLIAGIAQDVTDEVQARQAYRQGLALYRDVFDHAGGGLLLCRDDGVVVRANLACSQLLGYAPGEASRRRIEELFNSEERREVRRLLEEIRAGQHQNGVVKRFRSSDGSQGAIEASFAPILVGEEASHHIVIHIGDVGDVIHKVEELRSKTKSLESEANEDPLTGLMNRRGLEKALQGNKQHAERSGESMVVMLIDLDDFKSINDTCGHPVGDQVLKEVSRRFRRLFRPTDLVARIGGDEFLVLLPDTRLGEGMHVGERLRRELLSEPVAYIEGRPIFVTASIGAARVPDPVTTLDGVIALATRALKLSKKSGKNRVRVEGHNQEFEEQKERIERALGELLEGRGLYTVRQSIRSLEDGGVAGYEFFSRCTEEALADPTDFFRICMDRNILGSTDLECLRRAVQASRDCEPDVQLNFNLFPGTLLETPDDELLEILHPVGDLSRICLEISEQHFVGDPLRLRASCEAVQRHGVRIAIDDVGFGRSSLETLIVLEPDAVKVDRSMAHGISDSGKKQRMLSRLVNVAVSLELQMIVEGVESNADRRILRELGVVFAQGFLWGRPERIGPAA